MTKPTNTKRNEYYDEFRKHIEERITELKPSGTYTLEQIIAPEVWAVLSIFERRHVGIYIANLVRNKRLPLIIVGKINGNTKLYQIFK